MILDIEKFKKNKLFISTKTQENFNNLLKELEKENIKTPNLYLIFKENTIVYFDNIEKQVAVIDRLYIKNKKNIKKIIEWE